MNCPCDHEKAFREYETWNYCPACGAKRPERKKLEDYRFTVNEAKQAFKEIVEEWAETTDGNAIKCQEILKRLEDL